MHSGAARIQGVLAHQSDGNVILVSVPKCLRHGIFAAFGAAASAPRLYPSGRANATRRASGPAPVAIRMSCRPARER